MRFADCGQKVASRLALALFLFSVWPASASAWWNSSWGLRRKISFNNSGQPSNLIDFPVLIKLDSTRVEYFRTQDSGQDIRFVDADDTTLLDHEIELWNEAGTSYVWVRVPQINGSSSTDYIWMYYDNPTALDGQNAAGVWSNGYRGVWHFKEPVAGPFVDSTSNPNDATVAVNPPLAAAGQVDGALGFEREPPPPGNLDRHLAVADHPSLQLASNITVSAWVKTTVTDPPDAQSRVVLAKWGPAGQQNYFLGKVGASFSLFVDAASTSASVPLTEINDGSWHLVAGVADTVAGNLRLYVDGVLRATAAYDGSSVTGTSPLFFSENPDSSLQWWDGTIDEPRVAGVARSDDWVRAQYLSMSDTFASYGPATTAVELQSFSATARDSAVDLAWATASELHNLGFHLYRSTEAAGPWSRITSSLIPGLGSSPTGASYNYRDGGLSNGTTYFYLLEDVETSGHTEQHGPVFATPQAGGSSGEHGGGEGGGSGDGSGGSGGGRITYGDPSGTSLRILERGPSHVVLELITPGFSATTQDDGSVRLAIPGFEETASPGALAIPVRHALVEALAGRKVRLASVTPEDIVSFDSFRLTAAGTREIIVGDDGMVRAGSSPRPLLESQRRGGFAPRLWARLLGTLFQGETKKARLELSPLRHHPASGRTLLARRLTVRLEFVGIEAGERSLGGTKGRRPPFGPSLRRKGTIAQLVAREGGLYEVRFEDVFGQNRRGVNARSLRLSRLGQDVPYHLEPDKALFAPGSTLFFVSQGEALNPRGDAVYELSLGQTALHMEVISGSPSGPTTTEYLHTLRLEQNHYYQAALLQAPDLWLWDLLVSPITKSYPFTVEALSPSSTSSHLKVILQGASDFPELDHHLRLSANGIPVGEATWDGKVEQVIEVEISPGVLLEGSNTLAIENVGDAGAAYSMVFLNRFEVSYPRLLNTTSGSLEGRLEQSGRTEISGLPGPSFVVDTTSTPVWLKNLEPTAQGLAFRGEAGRSYLAVSEAALRNPEVRRSVSNRLRSTTQRADWILIAPKEFLPAAQPLVELRRSQGLRSLAVALEDVYAEFGFGEASPQALHDFLAFAFHNWKTPPRYVLLLGDSTYDPKDYLGTHVKDRLPSPILQTTYLWTTSDPSLAAVNGDDLLPDLALGRLSAGSVEEAKRLVSKLVAFEQAGRTFSGKAVLVADNADLAGNFEADQDEIAATVLTGREVEKVYLRDLGGATRTTIKAALDSGPGLLSYVGHGATAVWASENVWNNTDIATLSSQSQQPLLLTLNCLNGFFHFPPFDSLAEAFVKAEGKGAIAAFSPSGLSVNHAAHLYHKAFLNEIEAGTHLRLGDALLAAQKTYADQGAMPELLSIYHLFGDPAMKIR